MGDQARVSDPRECLIEDGLIFAIPERYPENLLAAYSMGHSLLVEKAFNSILIIGKRDGDLIDEIDGFAEHKLESQTIRIGLE
jgi:hypothetical protein